MFFILLIAFLTLTYLYLKYNFQYWKRRNVEGPEPTFLVGNIGEQFMGKKPVGEIFGDIYKKYPDLPFVGIYRATTPCLLVRDPQLLKDIYVSHFKHFSDNDLHVDKKYDPLFGRNPFVLKGEEWKNTRNILTPCFTTGKMKSIFPLVNHSGEEMVKYLNNNHQEPIEGKEIASRFTIDNVASCGFGLEGKCFVEPYSEFRHLANQFLTPGTVQTFKIGLNIVVPALTKFLRIKVVRKSVEEKLSKIIRETIEYREKNNIQRQDFLHFMNQLRYQPNSQFTLEDITAQIAAFFIDGYETSSISISYLLYELACHPDKQTKLREEINNKLKERNGELTYETLNEMTYLEACFHESLRKNTLVFSIVKLCTEKFTYTPSEKSGFKNTPITIEQGMRLAISFLGLYHDPKYFDDPDKFIPERFLTPKNATKADAPNKYVFKPFSEGPRACLGQNFASLQIKTGIVHIIKNFSLSLNEKTKLPFKYDPWHFASIPVGGIWLNFKKI